MNICFFAVSDGLFDFFNTVMSRGGPLMWPILFCSILAVAMALHKFCKLYSYKRSVMKGTAKLATALVKIRERKINEGIAIAEESDSPYAAILVRTMSAPTEIFEGVLESSAQQLVRKLRFGFGLLDTIVTVAPMLGILGTVTGIITSFDMMGSMGVEDPTAVTGGIAEALLTTAAGLTVSMIALLPLNYGRSVVKQLIHELEDFTQELEFARELHK